MRKLLMGVVAALAAITFAPTAQANPSQGDQCMNWHATTTDNNGNFLVCTHLPQTAPGGGSGHIMYWESSIQDRSYRTSGFKTDPSDDWYGFGSGHPCNSNDVTVIKIDPVTHNAIERWGPKGCDPVLPMTGNN
jgi:hypothetical protein